MRAPPSPLTEHWRERGRTVSKRARARGGRVPLHATVRYELEFELRAHAIARGTSLAQLVEQAVERELAHLRKTQTPGVRRAVEKARATLIEYVRQRVLEGARRIAS